MNTILLILSCLVVLGVLAIIAFPARRHSLARLARAFVRNFAILSGIAVLTGRASLANDGGLTVGEHELGRVTGFIDSAPTTTRFLLVKQANTGDNHYTVVTSVLDMPMGVLYDEPAATTDPVHVQLINSAGRTLKMVAAGPIPAGAIVVTNGDGRIAALSSTVGVYWGLGVAVTSALNANDQIEVDPSRDQVGVSFIT